MTRNIPRFSVITAHYGDFSKLGNLLRSLERQTLSHSLFEWVVVDDASPSGPPGWFENYDGSLNIIPISLKENTGRAKARNLALKEARGEVIVFIDADMVAADTWLEVLNRALKECGGVVVGARFPHPQLTLTPLMRYLHTRGSMKLEPGDRVPGKYFASCNSAVPREWIERIGGFDETVAGWGGEDLDFGLRLEEAGAEIYFEAGAQTWHDHERTWEDMEKQYLHYGKRTVPWLLERHPHAEQLLSLDTLRQPSETRNMMKKFKRHIVRFACRPWIYSLGSWKVKKFPWFPWHEKVFDYLIFYLYSRQVFAQWESNGE